MSEAKWENVYGRIRTPDPLDEGWEWPNLKPGSTEFKIEVDCNGQHYWRRIFADEEFLLGLPNGVGMILDNMVESIENRIAYFERTGKHYE